MEKHSFLYNVSKVGFELAFYAVVVIGMYLLGSEDSSVEYLVIACIIWFLLGAMWFLLWMDAEGIILNVLLFFLYLLPWVSIVRFIGAIT